MQKLIIQPKPKLKVHICVIPHLQVDVIIRKRGTCTERNLAVHVRKNIIAMPMAFYHGKGRMGKQPE